MTDRTNISINHDFEKMRHRAGLACYAADARTTRGRLIVENVSPTRSDFQRDRDRIIHADAFRRLMHKTQVFVHNERDHFRTRLTHTIEVGQIARALARALGGDEDLAEALALVHDFGHTPFGHAGERILNDNLKQFGGFDHNAQSLRIVTQLERRYAEFDGLNLTWETLEGLIKHNGPLLTREGVPLDEGISPYILEYNKQNDLDLWSWPSLEAQCAAIADDVAYDNHDLDDGLRAGLFCLDDLSAVQLSGGLLNQVRDQHPKLDYQRMSHEVVRRQITFMVEDIIKEAMQRLQQTNPQSSDEVRALDQVSVCFSESMSQSEKELKKFLFERMYRHDAVMRAVEASQSILDDLFKGLMAGHISMPEGDNWSLDGLDEKSRAYRIADYLAGMTDRYAVAEHQRQFDHTPELR